MNIGDSKLSEWHDAASQIYVLRLFVTGVSPISVRAINNLRVLLEEKLKGRYELEIIDVHQQPLIAKGEDIWALPMLIKKFPLPFRRLVGDMSDTKKVLRGLGLN